MKIKNLWSIPLFVLVFFFCMESCLKRYTNSCSTVSDGEKYHQNVYVFLFIEIFFGHIMFRGTLAVCLSNFYFNFCCCCCCWCRCCWLLLWLHTKELNFNYAAVMITETARNDHQLPTDLTSFGQLLLWACTSKMLLIVVST